MAGTAIARALNELDGKRFAIASQRDDAEIRRVLRENAMEGTVRLSFEREPDYFRGTNIAGADDQTIVAHSKSRLVCIGRCSKRDAWVDGVVRRIGYLAELRLDGSASGQYAIVRDGYRFFQELERETPADIYFTSIGEENHRARRFLERGIRGMPKYTYLAKLTTVVLTVPRHGNPSSLRIERATPAMISDLIRVLNEHGKRHQLAAVWTSDMVTNLTNQGLPLDRFLLLKKGDHVVACGALWDQRGLRQTVIRGYAWPLSAVRPLVNAIPQWIGIPRLPRIGSILAHAFVSPLAFADGCESMLPECLGAFLSLAREAGVEYLTIALPAQHPHLDTLRRQFRFRTWTSCLYQVSWPGENRWPIQEDRLFLPDVAFL